MRPRSRRSCASRSSAIVHDPRGAAARGRHRRRATRPASCTRWSISARSRRSADAHHASSAGRRRQHRGRRSTAVRRRGCSRSPHARQRLRQLGFDCRAEHGVEPTGGRRISRLGARRRSERHQGPTRDGSCGASRSSPARRAGRRRPSRTAASSARSRSPTRTASPSPPMRSSTSSGRPSTADRTTAGDRAEGPEVRARPRRGHRAAAASRSRTPTRSCTTCSRSRPSASSTSARSEGRDQGRRTSATPGVDRRLLQHPPRDGGDDPRPAEPPAHARQGRRHVRDSTRAAGHTGRCSRTRAARSGR